MIQTQSFCSWNMQLWMTLNDWKVDDMGRLIEILDPYNLGDREDNDERTWLLDEEKGFSIQSMYLALVQSKAIAFLHRSIWNKMTPSKISFFLWQFWWDCIPSMDNLIRRGFITPIFCSMCREANETSSHLFVHCKMAAALRDYMLVWFKVYWVVPRSMRVILSSWQHQSFSNINELGKGEWNLIPAAVCWTIGKLAIIASLMICKGEWNLIPSLTPLPKMVDSILSKIYEWFSPCTCIPIPFRVWIFDWDSLIWIT